MDATLRRNFALVDAGFCFVAKRCTSPTVQSVLRVANSFGSPTHLTRQHVVELAAHAPDLLILGPRDPTRSRALADLYGPSFDQDNGLEVVTFPLVPQTSQRASAKRKRLFDAALQKRDEQRDKCLVTETKVGAQVLQVDEDRDQQFETMDQPVDDKRHNEWQSSILNVLEQTDLYANQIVHVERRHSCEAQYRPLGPLHLSPRVCGALEKCYGITQLYSHQFEAVEAIGRSENVVLSTTTASGKSLAYNMSMLEMLLEDAKATFVYLFPTKALAQDQLKSLRRLLEAAELPLHLGATFDGDTPMKSRSMVIRETRIFLTNVDMLHVTILPQHRHWKRVFSNLRLLVVDEAHMYRGVFGSHVACVFRRLFRLCALYGSNPQVVCCSATIQNPETHFRQLMPRLPPQLGESVSTSVNDTTRGDLEHDLGPPSLHFFRHRPLRVITKDGAPTAEKLFCIWNPKVSCMKNSNDTRKDEHAYCEPDFSRHATSRNALPRMGQTTRKRKRTDSVSITNRAERRNECQEVNARASTSAIFQGSRILARLVEAEIATLLFCRSRKLTELVLMGVHSILRADPKTRHLVRRVSSYRGGYTLESRRRIEQRLFSGDLLGTVATNALELGIDVGELDCTIHLGLPSSVASLWQQAGRAGRRQQQSAQKQAVAVIVCFDSPLDQYFAQQQHAKELFQLNPEAVSLNPLNRRVLGQHMLCAARESALYSSHSGTAYIDAFVFGRLGDGKCGGSDSNGHVVASEVLQSLVKENKLMECLESGKRASYRVHSCMPKKFRAVSLRSICDEIYTVVVTTSNAVIDGANGEVLDEIPGDKAFFQVYPKAVYLHQAQEYVITRVDNDLRIAFAMKCLEPLTYFTSCRDSTDLEVVRIHNTTRLEHGSQNAKRDCVLLGVGTVSILTRVFGSTMLEKRTMRVLGSSEFSLPPMQSFGEAVWLEFPATLRQQVEAREGASWTAALHGIGHLFVALVHLFILCDAEDVGTEHVNEFERRVKPNRVTIYEKREGGCGLVPEIVKVLPKLVEKSWTIISECGCSEGCPACIQSSGCSEYNHVLDKQGSLQVLDYVRKIFRPQRDDSLHVLHVTILPQHRHWKRVFSNLRLLVVGEAHMYRGVFGSHVACVFRRLFRLCAVYGSNLLADGQSASR
ncbi:unnamed protein product [Hyaloperonospora brassicae]|uniref:Helicase ATP-binding domain-containing protein n=1 Tax=Hyaloperonospora brassicae TaxID=162125 RepID=A0AAV0T6R1_HYABA|nr:unnamed protein product [Hyaloperonospora brassicae]